jgi:hypothetical protein
MDKTILIPEINISDTECKGRNRLRKILCANDTIAPFVSTMVAEQYLFMEAKEQIEDIEKYVKKLPMLKNDIHKSRIIEDFYKRYPGIESRILESIQSALSGSSKRSLSKRDEWLVKNLIKTLKKIPNPNFSWPGSLILSTILGNIRENNKAIDPIRSALFALKIPIRKWLIEYKEHLFTDTGEETYEPVFYRDYLKRTADCMWLLSIGVFGNSLFSYRTLAAQMRESDEWKVRLAVKRIGIITTKDEINPTIVDWWERKYGQQIDNAIWFGEDGWKWNMKEISENGKHEKKCVFIHIGEVKERIEMLSEPVGVTND